MAARAWVLNLDADLELEKGDGYTRPRAIEARVERWRAEARHLLGPDDVVVDGRTKAVGLEGHAFCMTPLARRALEDAGAVPVAAPPVVVLRRVNHRRFSASLGDDALEGVVFATDRDQVQRALAAIDTPLGALLKRPFGFAGRGQRRVRLPLTEDDERWLAATPLEEGVQVEPRVGIVVETSVHAVLDRDGTIRRTSLVIQECDAGAWQRSRPPRPGEIDPTVRDRALAEAERVGRALDDAGYYGPFGVDGFVYEDAGGATRFRPRSEINARYTMGWSLRTF